MTKEEVREAIENVGIIPAIRVSSAHDAEFAAEAVSKAGIPIVEVTMTLPGAVDVMRKLAANRPELIVGAGTVLESKAARECAAAGAKFLTSTGFDAEVVEVAQSHGIVAIPGALTPTEVMMACKSGADFVKIFPCAQMGGPGYIRALRAPFPHVPLIASGGVTQQTAMDFILAGAAALGIGVELIPHDAIERRDPEWICELARRFLWMVKTARRQREEHAHHAPVH